MPDALYFEDFPLGEVVEYGRVDVSVDEIIAFAREFDPQPFHTDEEAAAAATGGLIASGWHTSALLLRMNCEAFLMCAAILEEAGVEEVRWQQPVRPGDRLHVRRQTLACRSREGRTSVGEVEFLYEVINQNGVAAMTQRSLLLLKQRPQALAARGSPPRVCMWRPQGCVDWWTRAAPCAPRWPSAARPFRSLACRQVSKTCAGRTQSMRAISFRIRWRPCRNARPPSRDGVSSPTHFAPSTNAGRRF
jgi:acyl dehydratase